MSPINAATDVGDVAAALAYADLAASCAPELTWPIKVDRGDVALARRPTGMEIQTIDLSRYLDRPRRKAGTVTTHNALSFLSYFEKHADAASELWADEPNAALVGVLDAHEARNPTTQEPVDPGIDGARWGVHRVSLHLKKTREWIAWTSKDNTWMSQEEFAEFLEEHAQSIVNPVAATMLELAQNFQATTGARFSGGTRLDNGQRTFSYVETVDGRAGVNGQLDIPARIGLAIEVFETQDARHEIGARFRYRIGAQGLRLGYILDTPEDTARAAYREVLAAVEAGLERDAWRGVPLAPGNPA